MIMLSAEEDPKTKAEAFRRGRTTSSKLARPHRAAGPIRHHSKGYISLLERNRAYQALATQGKSPRGETSAQASKYVRSLLPCC